MGNFTPIAMRCTREQFEAIKPKLKENNLFRKNITSFNGFVFLVNNYMGNFISNLHPNDRNLNKCNIYETWDEKKFLEACGIEKEETFKITKEQLRIISADGCDYVEQWFPRAFETVLEVGKWYIWKDGKTIAFIEKLFGNDFIAYGINHLEQWRNSGTINWTRGYEGWRKATESEVLEALNKEAVKRGYAEGNFKCLCQNKVNECKNLYNTYSLIKDQFWTENGLAYSKGNWAEIIPPITKKEAEKLLNNKYYIL